MAPKGADYIEIAHQRAVEKKNHVSFPQLKYPSLRDEGLKHPVQWLKGKAMDDGAEGLWRVNNGLYDLTDFVSKHPGGAEWLELSKGTDITEAFEVHHFSPVENILQKYYVRDATTPRNSPFTFEDDGFYRTLKRAVIEELRKVPKHTHKMADLITDALFVTCLITSVLACWAQNHWVVFASYLIASFTLATVVVASHNYIHRGSNWRMYLFNFSLWSYRDFRVSHLLSHHLYTNTLMDLEVSAFEPILFWNPRRDKPTYGNMILLLETVIFPLMFINNFIIRFVMNFIENDFFSKHYRWHDGVGLLLPVWMYYASGTTLLHAIIMWLCIVCTASFIFCTIGSNAAHHHPKIFKDGDQARGTTLDWGIHELEAVMDRKDVNDSLFKVMIMFGDHALHHLFPTLDHAVLSYLYPVFLDLCKKFKGNFRVTSQYDLFIGQLQMSVKKEPNVLEE